MPFLVKTEEAKKSNGEIGSLTELFGISIPDELIPQFLELLEMAKSEITQDIISLTEEALRNPPTGWDQTLRFCLISDNDSLVGFGIGHDDYNRSKTFYIDTIYVAESHRSKGIAGAIFNKFIDHSTEDKWRWISAVTQPDNKAAIKLLLNAGFEYQKREN